MLAGHHGFDGDGSMKVQRQSDDDRFDAIVLKQCIDPAVGGVIDFDVLFGFVLVGVLVLLDQPGPSWRGPVAVEGAVDTVGTNICDRRNLDILRRATTDEHVSFIARSDDTNANRIGEFLISEIHRTQARAANGTGSNDSLQKFATGKSYRFVIIVLTDRLVFCTQSTHSMTSKQIRFKLVLLC